MLEEELMKKKEFLEGRKSRASRLASREGEIVFQFGFELGSMPPGVEEDCKLFPLSIVHRGDVLTFLHSWKRSTGSPDHSWTLMNQISCDKEARK
ncbi:hypothetical protein LSTR_LSTR001433 [Laodelphax striatellus]|uniref:Uncharacterized protein n=1 Tax=Laodelphax striatellus TaxID=195883 RepID=A0A482XAZ1_LAOST|nr:hypothetical protein LSTR_LSTR001433 [Laodelphax striatellus]